VSAPRTPAGLGAAGRRLWRSIHADLDPDWELDARELDLLSRAARCADEIAALEKVVDEQGTTTLGGAGQVVVHPALAEARQLRTLLMRLLGQIELHDPAEKQRAATPRQRAARRAAEVRWGHR
jgi:hypothetical protein